MSGHVPGSLIFKSTLGGVGNIIGMRSFPSLNTQVETLETKNQDNLITIVSKNPSNTASSPRVPLRQMQILPKSKKGFFPPTNLGVEFLLNFQKQKSQKLINKKKI